ncbi:hypothetical protein BDN71DRAFT_1395850, partial [Pleurotus eryngii]
SVTTPLSDSLMSVSKLLSSGKNYTMFSERFKIGIDTKGFWGHFNSTTSCPPQTVSVTDGDIANASGLLLMQKLPDMALVLILGIETVKECWGAIVKEYSKKGFYTRAGLQRQFLDLRCGDKEDVH